MSKQATIAIAALLGLPLVISTGLAAYLHASATEEIAQLGHKGTQPVSVEKIKKISGKFQGSVGADHSSIETTFRNENGKLAGVYESFGPNNEKYEGTIDQATEEGNGAVACFWHDKYGSGPVRFKFDKEFYAFQGTWDDKSHKSSLEQILEFVRGQYSWDGVRATKSTLPSADNSTEGSGDDDKKTPLKGTTTD